MHQKARRTKLRLLRRGAAPLLAAALLAGACSAKDADEAAKRDDSAAASGATTTTAAEAAKFGTLPSPCGPGHATIQADQAGGSPDKIRIGVANDREGIRPGLFKEVWDASTAFVAWCNDQGGIDGLPLEAVDLDGKVFEIEPAMATACTGVFALVGGGWGQDDLMFTGKDGSDFHKCKLMAFPGFAVSPDFAEASDQVPASPNPAHVKDASYFTALAKLYPEQAKKFGVIYSNVPSVTRNKDQQIGMAKQIDGFGEFAEVAYDVVNQDWSVLAQQVIDKGLQMVSFNGESPSMALFSQALKDQGWEGVLLADANQYDSRLSESSGPAAVDGIVVRFAAHTFEEQDQWPAVKQLTGILDAKVPGWQHAGLAIQSFSANLLFATAVKTCADAGVITRECVLMVAGSSVRATPGPTRRASAR
jgi:ABC-type branched-subunit amino acid transport system substrate-binding protein